MKALLIEDNEDHALIIREMLSQAKGDRFDLEWANRLSTGLERLAEGGIDVVLLDLGLPDSQGLDTFAKVSAQTPEVPIVVLTGLDDEALAIKTLQKGAQEHLAKEHVNSAMLARVLRYSIERHRLQADLKQRSQELQSSEHRMRRIIEKNADGIVVVDWGGIVRLVNPAAEALFGRKAEELLGEPFGFPVVAGDWVELDILRKGGDTTIVEMRVVETEWEGETAYLASLHDITERKRAEEALRESEERFQLALRAVDEGVWEWNIAENSAYLSPRWKSILGYADDEIPNKAGVLDKYVHPDDREKLSALMQDYIEGRGSRYEIEFRAQHKDGSYRWIQSNAILIRDANGRPLRIVGSHKDITERKRAEEALRESEARYRQLAEASHDLIFVVNREMVAEYCNSFAAQMVGRNVEDTVGIKLTELFPPQSSARQIVNVKRVFDTGEPSYVEAPVVLRQRTAWLGTWLVPLQDESGAPRAVLGVSRDITERKRAEEESQRHLERIQALREIDRAITSTLDLTEVLDIILKELERVIPYHSAGIFFLSDGTAKLAAGRGFPDIERALQVSFPVEEDTLFRETLRDKRPVVLADAQADERFLARGGAEYVRSWIGVPLIAKGREVGFLTIDHREPRVYDEESAEMAHAFGSQVAIAIENARLYEEAKQELAERRRAERLLQALNQAGLAMERALTPEEIFTAVAREFKKLGFACMVFLTDESQSRLFVRYFSYAVGAIKALEKLTGLKIEGFSIPIETTDVYGKVVQERKAAFIENVEDVTRQFLPEFVKGFAGQIVRMLKIAKSIPAPLIVEDEVIGLLSVESDDLTENDIPAITAFAHQMAAAWRKAQLLQDLQMSLTEREQAQAELQQSLERLQRALESTIRTTARIVETRDLYTAGHQQRVAQLACAIAQEMGLPEEQIEGIRMAAVIHDVGKISVPAEILSKPTRLTELEFGMIKTHPQVGSDILNGAIDFPWPVAEIVLQHHERMNGSGYPQGLSGQEILLEARILGVADVVEAMSSHRPYRPARGIDKALDEISQNRGVLYDPEVVDACLRLFAQKGFEFEKIAAY